MSMNKIIIDQHAYDLDTLPAEARAHIESLRYVDAEIARLQVIQDHLNTLQCNAYQSLCDLLQTANTEDPPE